MAENLKSQGGTSLLIMITVSILMALLFSNWISSPMSQTFLIEVEAQQPDTTSLQGKIDDLRSNAQNMAKKLREVRGRKYQMNTS